MASAVSFSPLPSNGASPRPLDGNELIARAGKEGFKSYFKAIQWEDTDQELAFAGLALIEACDKKRYENIPLLLELEIPETHLELAFQMLAKYSDGLPSMKQITKATRFQPEYVHVEDIQKAFLDAVESQAIESTRFFLDDLSDSLNPSVIGDALVKACKMKREEHIDFLREKKIPGDTLGDAFEILAQQSENLARLEEMARSVPPRSVLEAFITVSGWQSSGGVAYFLEHYSELLFPATIGRALRKACKEKSYANIELLLGCNPEPSEVVYVFETLATHRNGLPTMQKIAPPEQLPEMDSSCIANAFINFVKNDNADGVNYLVDHINWKVMIEALVELMKSPLATVIPTLRTTSPFSIATSRDPERFSQIFYAAINENRYERIDELAKNEKCKKLLERSVRALFLYILTTKPATAIPEFFKSDWSFLLSDEDLAVGAAHVATSFPYFRTLVEHGRYMAVYNKGLISQKLTSKAAAAIAQQAIGLRHEWLGNRILGIACITLLSSEKFPIEPAYFSRIAPQDWTHAFRRALAPKGNSQNVVQVLAQYPQLAKQLDLEALFAELTAAQLSEESAKQLLQVGLEYTDKPIATRLRGIAIIHLLSSEGYAIDPQYFFSISIKDRVTAFERSLINGKSVQTARILLKEPQLVLDMDQPQREQLFALSCKTTSEEHPDNWAVAQALITIPKKEADPSDPFSISKKHPLADAMQQVRDAISPQLVEECVTIADQMNAPGILSMVAKMTQFETVKTETLQITFLRAGVAGHTDIMTALLPGPKSMIGARAAEIATPPFLNKALLTFLKEANIVPRVLDILVEKLPDVSLREAFAPLSILGKIRKAEDSQEDAMKDFSTYFPQALTLQPFLIRVVESPVFERLFKPNPQTGVNATLDAIFVAAAGMGGALAETIRAKGETSPLSSTLADKQTRNAPNFCIFYLSPGQKLITQEIKRP